MQAPPQALGKAISPALTPQRATQSGWPSPGTQQEHSARAAPPFGALCPLARVRCGRTSQAGPSRLQAEATSEMGSHLCAGGRGMHYILPKARSYICLAQALGLQFKSLFIDSYKGESELLTCLHFTKSIRIKGTRAELPRLRCRPAGWPGSGRAIPAPAGAAGHVSSPWACSVAPN